MTGLGHFEFLLCLSQNKTTFFCFDILQEMLQAVLLGCFGCCPAGVVFFFCCGEVLPLLWKSFHRAFHGGSFDLYSFRLRVKSSFVMIMWFVMYISGFTFGLQQK